MAFTDLGSLGATGSTANNQASLALTTAAAAAIGELVIVVVAVDNRASGGDDLAVTAVQNSGTANTWVKAIQVANAVAAQGGASCSIWYTIVTSAIASGATITATFGDAAASDASGMTARHFSLSGGNAVAIEGTPGTLLGNSAADPGSLNVTTSNIACLRVRGIASQVGNNTNLTPTSTWTAWANGNSATTGTTGEMCARAESLISTGTGAASDPTYVSAIYASAYVAFKEVTQAIVPVTTNLLTTSLGNETVRLGASPRIEFAPFVSAVVGSGPSTDYYARAVRIPVRDYLGRDATIGPTNSSVGIISAWLNIPTLTVPGSFPSVVLTSGGGLAVSVDFGNNINFSLYDDTGDNYRDESFENAPLNAWFHVLYSWDVNYPAGSRRTALYINDVLLSPTVYFDEAGAAFAVDLAPAPTFRALDCDGGPWFDAADFGLWIESSIVESDNTISLINRRKFIDAAGKPVDPTNWPAGVNAKFSGPAETFATNLGSGGAFTLRRTGFAVEPIDDASSPSGGGITTVVIEAGSGTANVAVIGEQVDVSVGTVTVVGKAIVPVTTNLLTSAVGDVAVTAKQAVTVPVAGEQITATVGSVSVATAAMAGVGVWNGSAWVERPVKVWNGSAWVQKPVKHWDGSSWAA
jgi:hypothetical protein